MSVELGVAPAATDALALGDAWTRFEDIGADLLAAKAAAEAAVANRAGGPRRRPVTPALHAIETRAILTPHGARDRRARRQRPRHQGDRRAAQPLAAHGREPAAGGLRQA